jgi:5S rRNA maturation endonuclease (ribonuclease M5)
MLARLEGGARPVKTGFGHIVDKLAYDDYLRRLDCRAVLDHYGIENDREEPGRLDTTEIVHSCLLDRVERHHNNGDANPSASCNVDRKQYVCWAFWGGNMFDFIAKMEDKEDFSDILPLVRGFLGESTLNQDTFMAELDRIFASTARGTKGAPLPAYNDKIITPWAWVHPYLAERGIDSDTASRLHIGWREDLNRLTIPAFWRGHLVGWQARAIPDRPGLWPGSWDGGFPKYKSSPGFPKSAILYVPDDTGGFSGAGREIVVVESPFSVIKAQALGVDRRVVATFGAKVSQRQIDLLAEADRVIVWADGDDAGRFMERKLVRGLHHRTRVSVVEAEPGVDLGDYESAELVEAKIESAERAILKVNEWGK